MSYKILKIGYENGGTEVKNGEPAMGLRRQTARDGLRVCDGGEPKTAYESAMLVAEAQEIPSE